MKQLVEKFKNLNGAKYICIKNYESTNSGEIANHTINVNVDIQKAKEDDLNTLINFDQQKLEVIAETVGSDIETAQNALTELVVSQQRNLTNDPTKQSKAQQDAYISIGKGLRLKPTDTSFDLYITGFANNKFILKEGEHKQVNSSKKTLVKNAIKKTLKMYKFRNFKIANADSLTVTGDTIQVS